MFVRAALFRPSEAHRKPPAWVGPGSLGAEARFLEQRRSLPRPVLVAVLCVNRLAGGEFNGEIERAHIHLLSRPAREVHFDPRRTAVPHGAVHESLCIEVRVEFAIEAHEHITIEAAVTPCRSS